MALPEHSKIINTIARQILKPEGLIQKGQSRSWLDDHEWFTTFVEFQPFQYQQGTCINVGVNFHWSGRDHWSFDIGYRESGFVTFVHLDQFAPEIEELAQMALSKVLFYRNSLRDPESAKQTILNHTFTSESLWGNYHKGIVCGITKDIPGLNNYFDRLLSIDDPAPFIPGVKAEISQLKTLAQHEGQFRQAIQSSIDFAREKKKLRPAPAAINQFFL